MNRTIKTKFNCINPIATLFLFSIFVFSALAQTNPVKVRYDVPRDVKLAPQAELNRVSAGEGRIINNGKLIALSY